MPYAVTGMGGRQVMIRKIDGEEILRRIEGEGVTLLYWRARGGRRGARRRGRAPSAARRCPATGACGCVAGRAAAVHDRAGRGGARLGVHPDLRAHRDLAAAHHQPGAGGVGRPRRPSERSRLSPRGAPRDRRAHARGRPRARCSPARTTSSRATGTQPEATAEAIDDGWFHTGDGGHRDDEHLVITDRKKDVIITGGENVSSIEVEDCLLQHPAVAEVAVIGVPDEKWGETVRRSWCWRAGARPTERRSHRLLPRPDGRTSSARPRRVPRRAAAHRHRQAPEVQAPRALLGRRAAGASAARPPKRPPG